MSKHGNRLELSRRQILAGLGGIGLASAGAGLGTSAYFNDTESFEGNTITAGELDLKVDWQQTYNGPIPGSGGEVGEHPVNAYPDTNGDGLQDLDGIRYSGAGDVEPVFDAADVPACCDCEEDEYYLTYGGESFCIEPLRGEVDIESFYDFTGGGGSVEYSSRNESIQREDTSVLFLYEDSDENLSLVFVHDAYSNEDGGSQASVTVEGAPAGSGWLVDTDADWQVKDDFDGDTDMGFESYEEWEVDWAWGSDRTDGGAIGYLEDDFALRVSTAFNGAANRDPVGRASGQITDFVVLSGGAGFDDGSDVIPLETDVGDDNLGPVTVHSACGIESGDDLPEGVFGEQDSLVELDDVKPGDSGEITFSLHLCDNPGYLWLTASNFTDLPGETSEPEPTPDERELAENTMVRIWYDDDCDNQHDVETEQLVFGPGIGGYTGPDGEKPATLAAAMDLIGASSEDGGMIPLDGDGDMGWDDGPESGNRDCLPGETGVCVGFEWWVPTSVGNEIQGDEVSFDLGFYTEQCRNNDGSGPDSGGT
jgi:predicted ribosomally synthesized peptide with SipW-like signal peptide